MKDGHCREWRAPVMKLDYQAELKKKTIHTMKNFLTLYIRLQILFTIVMFGCWITNPC